MDPRDLKIVMELVKNGRIKKTELAKMLKITETAVRKRIEKLEKNKVILGYRAVVDFKKLGIFSSLTGIDVEPEHIWKVVERLKQMENVNSVYLTSGDHVLMVEVVTDSLDTMRRLHEEISGIQGVKRVCPAVIMEVLK
ncbi:MAG: transcriptional regulator [Archaeoglobi archaeon]|nr:MAG: transcriptional regulator [Archaeoglobi archaeon]TDA28519.1 MAG: transcriptional regulator [Archaeoglobi archaeon]